MIFIGLRIRLISRLNQNIPGVGFCNKWATIYHFHCFYCVDRICTLYRGVSRYIMLRWLKTIDILLLGFESILILTIFFDTEVIQHELISFKNVRVAWAIKATPRIRPCYNTPFPKFLKSKSHLFFNQFLLW